jgi:hypothetical protein
MSSTLDCAFYKSFYSDVSSLPDSMSVNEHYLNVGKREGRMANAAELHELIAQLTHFDQNVYINANLAFNLHKTLGEQFSDLSVKQKSIEHYYGETGNLNTCSRFRVMNNNDLTHMTNVWESIYNKIFDSVHFNGLFYHTFYAIPTGITNLRDLQIHWLKQGVFEGQMPNLDSLNKNMDVIGSIQVLLMQQFHLDMAFIASYKGDMVNFMKRNSIPIIEMADENRLLLFLFLNTGYKLRLFFNANDKAQCVEKRRNQYNDAIESIKKGTYKKKLDANNKAYDAESIALMKASCKRDSVPIIPNNFADIISVKNIIKLSNPIVIDCYMKLYKMDSLIDVIITMVKNELKNSLEPIVNSMELKILVTSVVYNVFIKDKVDSILYKGLVKEKSVEILNVIFKEYGIVDESTLAALEQDVEYLMQNKQVIKLSYVANAMTKLVVNAFLMTL